jgi:putative Holliday junction resolvase
MIDQAAAVGILQNWLDQRRHVLAEHGGADDE